jgi:hypothetical protein
MMAEAPLLSVEGPSFARREQALPYFRLPPGACGARRRPAGCRKQLDTIWRRA